MLEEDVVERLTRRFGEGQRPLLRRALYHRLGEIVEREGERAEVLLSQICDYVERAHRGDKGKCFAFVAVRRFQERGFIETSPI